MSKVLGIYEDGEWEFYDTKLKKLENFSKGDELYLILPDNFFFFFQTDIVSKRRVNQTVKAYAKTLFSSVDNVGYVSLFNPIVGYTFKKEKLESLDDEILNAAAYITTPFLIFAYFMDSFAYVGNGVCAAVFEKRLKFYTVGDENVLLERLSSQVEIVKYNKLQTLENAIEIIKKREFKKINLSISGEERFENWKIWRFAAVLLIAFLFIIGMVVRYSTYSKTLKMEKKRLDKLYYMALGGKRYSDPYGILLYKADYGQKESTISPTKLLYFLSKAKDGHNLNIDFISLSDDSLKIRGTIDSYKGLLNYVRELNKMTGKKFIVRNTSRKKGRLKFVLVGNLYG